MKPRWWEKINDEEIVAKWRSELARILSNDSADENPFSRMMRYPNAEAPDASKAESLFEYLLEELRFIAAKRLEKVANPSGSIAIISPVTAHGAFISDSIVPPSLRADLVRLAKPVEDDAFRKGSWHEGTDQKVLDLVHPTNYCLMFEWTLITQVENAVAGEKKLEPPKFVERRDISTRFQWLPSDFMVSPSGKVKILSYINDLDPRYHDGLYRSIATILESMLPMFERAIAAVDTKPVRRIDAGLNNKGFQADPDTFFGQLWKDEKGTDPDDVEGFEFHRYMSGKMAEGIELPITVPTLPKTFLPGKIYPEPEIPRFVLNDRRIQVIVKMANIHLTPEKPRYEGSNWHLEGMENEAIIATGLYYYSLSNITRSRLSFRHMYNDEQFENRQDEFKALEEVYGFSNTISMPIQHSGVIEAREGLSVVFPNYLQHRVDPFELEDPTRDGHRKVLAFFFVHPDCYIPSTRHVPPQQMEWMERSLDIAFRGTMPHLCLREIAAHLGCISPAENYFIASWLTKERSVTTMGGFAALNRIFLCEH